ERALTAALLIIVYFGIVQTAWYIAFGVPLIGRVLWERPLDLGFVTIAGIPFYRLHSLAGEPRDLGAFLVGAIPFYLYIRTAAQRWTVFLNAAAMVAIFFLTMSTTAYLVGAVTIGIIILDTLVRKRRPIRPRHIAYGCATIAVVSALIYGQVAQLLMVRTFAMVGAIQAQIALREIQPIAAEQATNVVALYYLRSLVEMPLHIVFFGGGYSNFITPTAGLMQRYFGRSFAAGDIPTADAFAVKLLIEGGLVGIGLYVVLFITMLRCNGRLLAHFRVIGDREGYRRAVFLRYAYIGFFVAGSLQTSYFVFIVMGLMIGWANEVLHGTKPHGDRHTMGLPAPPLHDYAPVSAR
ncbi:MAG: hypothetical protein Q7T01_03535, partial [bacterium]|nr:hypothetical protein [bacterium]